VEPSHPPAASKKDDFESPAESSVTFEGVDSERAVLSLEEELERSDLSLEAEPERSVLSLE
jgi:hypothetical protein